MATAEQENFIGSTPCSCVCVCVCVRERETEREREIQEELQPEQSLWALSPHRAHCCPLFLRHWPLFSFLPSAPSFFSSATRPCGFSSPPTVSLGKPSQSKRCRDSPAATAREGESRRKKRKSEREREAETDQSITLRGERHEERRGAAFLFLTNHIFFHLHGSLLEHLIHVLPSERARTAN